MRPEKFIMTKHFLSSARKAHFDYQRRGELQKEKEKKERWELNQRREADEMKQKERKNWLNKMFINRERELSGRQRKKGVNNSLTVVLELLMEWNEKMKSAVEKGDVSKVPTAQLIIDNQNREV